MNVTVMSIIMVGLVVASVFVKKLPMQFTLCVVPVFCALGLGYGMGDISGFILEQCNKTMQASGYLILFALIYFTMVSETGMFEILGTSMLKLFRGKLNLYMMMAMTSMLAAIGMMTANVATAYLIVFPIMIPLYERFHFDKKAAMIIAQTSIAAMCFLPWGIAVVNSSVFAGVDAMELSRRLIPVSLCYIPAIVLQWIYFGMVHKKKTGIMSVDLPSGGLFAGQSENGMKRPKLFWINLMVFVLAIAALVTDLMEAYLVFMFAGIVTLLVNYPDPKDYQKLWQRAGRTFFNTIFMLIGISFFIGVFQQTGMVEAFATFLVSIFPTVLTRYLHILLAAIMIIVIRFMPNKIYNSTYPALISVGQKFGLAGTDVIAPFVTNMTLATGSSPFTPTTSIGTGILEIDTTEYCNYSMKIQTVTNLVILLVAIVTGGIY